MRISIRLNESKTYFLLVNKIIICFKRYYIHKSYIKKKLHIFIYTIYIYLRYNYIQIDGYLLVYPISFHIIYPVHKIRYVINTS